MSELYELPEGWEWKKLDEISKLVGGGTPRRNMNEYWDNGNIIWLSPTDLGKIGEIINISDSKDKITQLGLDKSSAKLLPIGTVLYSSRATIGKIAINTIEVSTNQGFTNFICTEHLNNQYLAYILSRFTNEITSLSNSTTFKEVSKSSLKEFKIPLPPLQEQKRIVSKLDTLFEKIDKSIALHQKNMDEADVFMGSVLNDIFGELEEKYEKDYLSNYCQITSSKRVYKADYVANGIIFYRIKDIVLMSKNLPLKDSQYIKEQTFNEFDQKFGSPKSGDILLTAVGATLGYAYLVKDSDGKFYFKDGNLLWLKNIINLDRKYLKYIFTSPLFHKYLNEISKGAAQPAITIVKLKEFNIPIPPLKIQQKIVIYLDKISKKIEKIKSVQKEKMESLIALKASILDQAFRGEL